MTNRGSLLAGAGLGTALTYFLDPGRGARRRARIRDATAHAVTLTKRGMGKAGRDARHRAYGTAASLGSLVRHDEVDDQILAERIRAKLGRLVSHAHAVDVDVSDGVATLKGPILEQESNRLVRAVGRIRGVQHVIDRLERHEQAGHVPALQGGRARTRVHIRMSYNPPAGWLGHGIATAFGVDPKHSLDEDLVRMKTLIETGHAAHDAARRIEPAVP